jgi:glycosyltransferase involved in cell wall biosynthesis
MSRPRIVLLITLAETGGAQTYVASLLPALAGEYDVTVAAHGDGFLADAARRAGVRYLPLRHMRRRIDPLQDLLGLVELVRLFRRERPAIVHANSSKAGILGRIAAVAARVPVRLFTVHGWAFKADTGPAARAYLWADRLMSPLTTTTICVAESERRAGLQARTCRADRTVVIHNGVAVGPHARTATPPPVTLLSVGRLRAPKDFLTLVRAVARLEPGSVRLRIAGDGPDREALVAELARLGLDGAVELLGTRADVAELLGAADVFVLSSDSEGMPMSVLEAMAAGLPVVATAVGGVPELVREAETGVLVPPRDTEALAAALGALVADGELRERLGEAARRRAEREFSLAEFRRAHLEVYRAALRR